MLGAQRCSAALPAQIVAVQAPSKSTKPTWLNQADAPPCHTCGEIMVRNGACYKCSNCGTTSGCS